MSDKKRITGTRGKKKEFAILPPQLQRIIYLTKYLSVFCFSKLSYALFQGVQHNICRYIRVCQPVRKKTFAGKPIGHRTLSGQFAETY